MDATLHIKEQVAPYKSSLNKVKLISCCMNTVCLSLVSRLLCGGGGKRAWYTLFTHVPSYLAILLRYTKIMVTFYTWLYSLWDTYGWF